MAFTSLRDVLAALLGSTTNDQVRTILAALGDYPDVELDKPFGPFDLSWHPYGDNPSNLSSIGLGTKPARSLTERLTNSMDAILEDRVPPDVAPPRSPRQAAQQWFGRPVSAPEEGLFKWPFSHYNFDRRISVVLASSGIEDAPTVDVVDEGVGIAPSHFPDTILSLQAQNKIQKWHLIGSFGQGGASTIGFCDYVLLVSRHRDKSNIVGFTLIRALNLSATYKEDSYAYLSLSGTDGNITVPSCDVGPDPLRMYPSHTGLKVPLLLKGTLVRHFCYKLSNLSGPLGPAPGNLYHYLHCSMFDPLFPFRLIDLRDPVRARDELVTGSRNRLMKLTTKRPTEEDEERGSEIRHHRPMEFVVPFGSEDPCIGIEYWVVFNYRKGRGPHKDELVLRPQSNELYIQPGHPILGTMNGQNQGELTAQLLRELGLGMVARHIVIHIDASNADSRIRRQLFSTSREGFKDGPVLESLIRVLKKMLEEDKTIFAIERELTERIAKREAESASEEVKKQVARLLLEAGFRISREGPSAKPGEGETEPIRQARKGRHVTFDPLPTLPFPQVTKFQIAVPKPRMEIPLNDIDTVLVETDADAEFDRRGLVAIRTEPDRLEQAGKAPLRGGRIRWRLKPRDIAKVGDAGKIVVTLTKPDGAQLSDATEFVVLAPVEERAKPSKDQVPPFDIKAINPEDHPEEWGVAWPNLSSDDVTIEQQASVAYKPVRVGGGITVYYSTVFSLFSAQVEKLKSQSATLSELFRTNYEIWVAYHAILQDSRRSQENQQPEFEFMEKTLEEERVRVARMQVKQSMRTAELIKASLQQQEVSTSED